jgi:5'-deoxynucleotidase YfbR-like HD superfamily hydrolase
MKCNIEFAAPAPGDEPSPGDPSLVERATSLTDAGGTVRWHTHGKNLQQTVAEHSWGVAAIILLLKPNPSVALLRAAILHDVHEAVMGDLPSPFKRRFADTLGPIEKLIKDEFLAQHQLEDPVLTPEEQKVLKLADKMEAMLFAKRREFPGLSEARSKAVIDNLAKDITEASK